MMYNIRYNIVFAFLLTFGFFIIFTPAFGQTSSEIDMVSGAGASASASCVSSNNCFSPNPLTVAPGTTVTWRNTDTVSHTVTSGRVTDDNAGSLFDSGLIRSGSTFQFTFANAGVYNYFCAVHPWMTGQVIVSGNTSPSTIQQPSPPTPSAPVAPAGVDISISNGAGASASAYCVSANNCYNPNSFYVNAGRTVTWFNGDTLSHTVTSGRVTDDNAGSLFDSGLIKSGSEFKVTFQNPGTYNYFCTVHPWMTGQIIVSGNPVQPPVVQQPSPPTIPQGVDIVMAYGSGSSASSSCVSSRNCFSPNQLFTTVGKSITWFNDDTISHTVTSGRVTDDNAGSLFDSGLIRSGGEFKVTFQNPGTYNYFCTVHPWMTGQVIVSGSNPSGGIQQGTMLVGGTSFSVPYSISNGKILQMNVDMQSKSLIVSIQTTGDGVLTIPLPRGLVDAQVNGQDDYFLVLNDGHESNFQETSKTTTDRTLSIPFTDGTTKIEVIGTSVLGIGTPPTNIALSVTTDKNSYAPGDTMTITTTTTGANPGQNIAINIIDSSGSALVSRTVTTNDQNYANLQFKLSSTSPVGTYQVIATTSSNGNNYKQSTQFTVQRPVAQVTIVSIQATDQQGNPVSSFSRGTNGFVKVVLSSQSSQSALSTVNLFGSDSTSIGIGSFKTTLGQGQSEMIISFYIPDNAVTGTANIYSDIDSDWPSKGGIPLTAESSGTVEIQ